MKNLAVFAAASAFGFASLAPALAAEEGPPSDTQQQIQGRTGQTESQGGMAISGQEDMNLNRTSKIVGEGVITAEGESLGEIKDIVIDSTGRISYVAVTSGALLGVGGDLHPVPWQALRWDGEKGDFVLEKIDKEAFKAAPTFSADDWPMEPKPEWAEFYREKGITEGFGAMDRGEITSDHPR